MKERFICEIGSNHNNSLERTKQIIDEASELGFWGIKFQLYEANELYSSNCIDAQNQAKKGQISHDLLDKAIKYSKKKGLKVGASIFNSRYLDHAKENFDFIKISSFDAKRFDLIRECIKSDMPLFISLGLIENLVEYFNEIRIICLEENINSSRYLSEKVVFFHCVSNYPTQIEDASTGRCKEISDYFNNIKFVGYSDHVSRISAVLSAIKNGASTIEIHYDLMDGEGNESKHGHCWGRTSVEFMFEMLDQMEIAECGEFKISKEAKSNEASKSGIRR